MRAVIPEALVRGYRLDSKVAKDIPRSLLHNWVDYYWGMGPCIGI